MALLSILETESIMQDFISKHSDKIECKVYEYEEKVRREGDQSQKIYIVKEGVFRISKTDTWEPDITVAFCFVPNIIVPVSAIVDDFPSLFQIKSIKNNLTDSHNSLYEIGMKQWNFFVERDARLKIIPKSVAYNGLVTHSNLYSIFHKTRKREELFSRLYEAQHSILNSGIEEKYIANFFGVSGYSLRRMHTNQSLKK
jgi:hypothetical protein